MRSTSSQLSSGRGRDDRLRLWYATHPHLRKPSTALEASRTAERISSGRPPGEDANEQSLFVAMHACAYRVSARTASNRAASPAERERWATRWQAIRAHIVERNMGLAHSMVGRFKAARPDHDDLLSEAMFALVRAVDRYNPWRGYRFSTYACNVIIRALMRRCRSQTTYQHRFPLIEAECCEEPEKKDSGADLYLERLKRVLRHNAGALTDIESKVLARRFPADKESSMTFREISKVIGLSRERIRQIEGIAIQKLRLALMADPLLQ